MSPRCRIVLFGAPATGKTSIVHRFLSNDIPICYDPTIEDAYRVHYFLGADHLDVLITDTAGKELFAGMRQRYITHSHGFIVVYSVKSRQSFIEAVRLCHLLGPVPKILVGNKADVDYRYREVTSMEGQRATVQMNCSFAETSSVTGVNNREVFDEILQEIREYKKWKKGQKSSLCCLM